MKKNMGTTDRVLRVLLAAAIGLLYFLHIISGVAATVLLIISVVFILTSLAGTCPIYTLLGINTCPRKARS